MSHLRYETFSLPANGNRIYIQVHVRVCLRVLACVRAVAIESTHCKAGYLLNDVFMHFFFKRLIAVRVKGLNFSGTGSSILEKDTILKNKRPNCCHLIFYFTSYELNMFRTLIYPSSGACDYSVEIPHCRIVLGSMCVGVSVWLGWSGIHVAG